MPYQLTSSLKMLVVNMFNLTDNKEFGNNDINKLGTNNIKTIYKTKKN